MELESEQPYSAVASKRETEALASVSLGREFNYVHCLSQMVTAQP